MHSYIRSGESFDACIGTCPNARGYDAEGAILEYILVVGLRGLMRRDMYSVGLFFFQNLGAWGR